MPTTTHRRSLSRLLLAAIVTAALVPLSPAHAGTVERIDAAPLTMPVPGSETGAMRTWVQLVWNPTSGTLERLSFTAFDPVPSFGLELSWQPDDPAPSRTGLIEGRGTLSFRTPGAPAYEPSGTVAQYRGTLVAGRPEGVGEYLDTSGFSYTGDWHDGMMEGQGRMTLADGDEYLGTFRAGRADGQGTLTESTGRIWSGHFTGGIPDAGPLTAQADTSLRLGVVTERRPHNYELSLDPLAYVTRSTGDTLTILPDDQRLLDVWHGNTSITMTDDEVNNFSGLSTPSFLGERERFDPVSLVFSLENTLTSTITVVGGFLDVALSARNPEPAMQVRPFPDDSCAAPDPVPHFFIDNFGWTSADAAALNFTVGAADGRSEGTSISLPLGPIAQSTTADLAPALKTLGVDTDFLAANRLFCSDPGDERRCLAELRQSDRFGKLADFMLLKGTTIEAQASGTLDYDWTTTDGSVKHKSSPFSVPVLLGSVSMGAECGEGGEVVPVRKEPFKFKLGQSKYRIALPFTADVTPGFTTRWRIELDADETSDHDFTIVLLMSDGSQVASRPVHLTYFNPPIRDELAHP